MAMEIEHHAAPEEAEQTEENPSKLSIGAQIDLLFVEIEDAFRRQDNERVVKLFDQTAELIERGGDWDRRNRRKVYQGIYHASVERDFVKAAALLVETIDTFSVPSFMPFERFVMIASICGLFAFDRQRMKVILENPNLIGSLHENRCVYDMGWALYNSDYRAFLENLTKTVVRMMNDDLLKKHVDWYCKEMRLKAYKQMLRSYVSVKIEVFAREFGLAQDVLERELEHFIALGRLHAQIDKVNGVVVNARKDNRNELYAELIRQGDIVLEKVQRLERKLE